MENRKLLDEKGSVNFERRYFTAFDSLDRVINKDNSIFYSYDTKGNLIEEKSIYHRDRMTKVTTYQYQYNQDGKLDMVIRIADPIDTIQTVFYSANNQIRESITPYGITSNRIVTYEYEDKAIFKKTIKEGDPYRRISNYVYDSLGKVIIENWVFSDSNRMKTTFHYDSQNRLITETDSSYKSSNPMVYEEFKSEYKYNSNDSITEIIKYGRDMSEDTFRYRMLSATEASSRLFSG